MPEVSECALILAPFGRDADVAATVLANAGIRALECPSVERLVEEPALRNYPFLPAVRGDLLEKLGRFDEARAEFERASELTRNAREQRLMRARAEKCSKSSVRTLQ